MFYHHEMLPPGLEDECFFQAAAAPPPPPSRSKDQDGKLQNYALNASPGFSEHTATLLPSAGSTVQTSRADLGGAASLAALPLLHMHTTALVTGPSVTEDDAARSSAPTPPLRSRSTAAAGVAEFQRRQFEPPAKAGTESTVMPYARRKESPAGESARETVETVRERLSKRAREDRSASAPVPAPAPSGVAVQIRSQVLARLFFPLTCAAFQLAATTPVYVTARRWCSLVSPPSRQLAHCSR
jgi:hypothetical protein